MWWITGKAGDRIVCIDAEWYDHIDGEGFRGPVADGVYTVSVIKPCHLSYIPMMVSLKEFGQDQYFDVRQFRPVDPASKKADRVLASIKPSLLNPIPIRKHETAGGE